MSNILNSEDFGQKLYNRFPHKYREDDVDQKYALKRYIESLSEGGFKPAIDDINGIATLVDPDRVGSDVLPILFKQYGLDIFNGIPENYLRYLLPRLGEAWSKKGSLSVVEFVTSSLSGIKTSTKLSYDNNENPTIEVKLEMDYNIGDYFPEAEQFRRLLENFVPFYCDVVMLYSYLFNETTSISVKEKDILKIVDDKKSDEGIIGSSKGYYYFPTLNQDTLNKTLVLNRGSYYEETDVHNDFMSQVIDEKNILRSSEELISTLKMLIVKEQGKLKTVESIVNKVTTSVIEEDKSVELKDVLVKNDLHLLNELEYEKLEVVEGLSDVSHMKIVSEKCNTRVKEFNIDSFKCGHIEESINIPNQRDNTLLNSIGSVLNSNMYMNGFYCYDIITIGNEVEVRF